MQHQVHSLGLASSRMLGLVLDLEAHPSPYFSYAIFARVHAKLRERVSRGFREPSRDISVCSRAA